MWHQSSEVNEGTNAWELFNQAAKAGRWAAHGMLPSLGPVGSWQFTKAKITSMLAEILKMDSTKKKPDLFDENEMDDGLDEGFVEEESDITVPPLPNPKPTTPIIQETQPSTSAAIMDDDIEMHQAPEKDPDSESDDAVGPGGIKDWEAIKNLASYLFSLKKKRLGLFQIRQSTHINYVHKFM